MWKQRFGNSLPHAIKLFKQIIEDDPEFARAYSALAAAYSVLSHYTKADRDASYAEAERTALTALTLNPRLSEPHAVLGRIYSRRLEWRRAERQFRHAIRLDPTDPAARFWYGSHSMSAGKLQQALTQYEAALSIDPAWGIAICFHSEALYALGQPEAATQGAKRAVAFGCAFGHDLLAHMAYEAGRFDQVVHHFVESRRMRGADEATLKKSRMVYREMLGLTGAKRDFLKRIEGKLQSGYLSLRFAFDAFYLSKQLDRAMGIFDLKADPNLFHFLRRAWGPYGRLFRAHPKFASIAETLNLLPYWREFGWPEPCEPDPIHLLQCH